MLTINCNLVSVNRMDVLLSIASIYEAILGQIGAGVLGSIRYIDIPNVRSWACFALVLRNCNVCNLYNHITICK